MTIEQLDVVIRSGTVPTLLLLAWLIFRDRLQFGRLAVLFVPLAICLSAFVIGNTPLASLRLGGVSGALANSLSGYTVIFLWWFCLSCFDSRFKVEGSALWVGLIWAAIATLDRGLLGWTIAGDELSAVLVIIAFGIVGHLVWRLIAERAGDLVDIRQHARITVAGLLGGMLFIDLAADTLFGFAWRPQMFTLIQNMMILVFSLWLATKLLIVRENILTFGVAPNETGIESQDFWPVDRRADALNRRLSDLMEEQKIYLDPDLSFGDFVKAMSASERQVRKLINQDLGYDHFRIFLNQYRVTEAKRLITARSRRNDKLIAVAMDSGFASLASFNRAFNAIEGCSPSEYRAHSLTNDAIPGQTSPQGVAANI